MLDDRFTGAGFENAATVSRIWVRWAQIRQISQGIQASVITVEFKIFGKRDRFQNSSGFSILKNNALEHEKNPVAVLW